MSMIKLLSKTNLQGKTVFVTDTTPTYNITSNVASVNEGSSVTFTLSTTNVADGTVLPYTITGVSLADLASGALTGNFTIASNIATASITLAADALTEGAETMTVTLSSGVASASVTVNDTSLTPTYNITSNVASVNEGSSVTFTLSTTNVANGTVLPYTITGISLADLASGALTGNFTIASGIATASITLAADALTEGNETMTVTLSSGVASASVTVNDTSLTPTYTITRSASSVNEGSSVTFTLSTTNVANGTILPYTISGISANDVTTGSLTGSFTVNGGTATTTITMSADQLTEGAETATLTLNNGAASNFVVVNDTSVWTPATISDLQLWLDAADSSTLFDATAGGSLVTTDGAAVARWQDKSGNNRHLIQSTANARPILKTSIKNSRNVIRFDGSNDYLGLSNQAFTNNISAVTMFAVFRSTRALSSGAYQTVIHQSISGSSNFTRASIYATDTIEAGGRRLDANLYQFVKASTLSTNEWVLAGSIHNYGAATLTAFKNGNGTNRTGGFQTSGNTSNTNSQLVSVGGTTGANEWLNGEIAEVLVYTSALTTAQRQQVETYLNTKWALY